MPRLEIGEVYDAPRRCPNCGHQKAEFRTTATDYGAWWKCVKCGEVFSSREQGVTFSTGDPNISALCERLSDLEKRVADLEADIKEK